MSYYKSCKEIKSKNDIVIDNFIDGYRIYYDIYKQLHKEKLETGCTKYNISILEEYNKLEKDFQCLLSIQCLLVNLIEKYVPNSQGKIRNIWRIIHSQKGTVNYYTILKSALKKYKVKHQNVYDALKSNIEKDKERVSRNTTFVDTTIIDCGIGNLVHIIKEKYDKSIFEYTKDFSENFFKNYDFTKDTIDYLTERETAYISHIENLANQYNIDLQSSLNQAENIAKEKNTLIKETIRKEKYENKMQEKRNLAKELNNQHHVEIYHCLETGNQSKYLSDISYNCLIRALQTMNGKCYYITILSGKKLQFYKYDEKIAYTTNNIAYFSSKNDNTLLDTKEKLIKKLPNAIISIEYINFNLKTNINGIKSISTIEEAIDAELLQFHDTVQKNTNHETSYHNIVATKLSIQAINRNNNKFYYICAIDTTSLKHGKIEIYGTKTPTNDTNNLCAKSLSDIEFLQDEAIVHERLKYYQSIKKYAKYKFVIQTITIENPHIIIDKIKQEIEIFKKKLINTLESFENTETWKENSIMAKSTKINICQKYQNTNHIKILIRKTLNHNPEILQHSHSETLNDIETIDNIKNISFHKYLTQRMIISTTPNGDKILEDLAIKMQKTDNKNIYQILDLTLNLYGEDYKKEKEKYIQKECNSIKRNIHMVLRDELPANEFKNLESHIKKSNTIYFLWTYVKKIEFIQKADNINNNTKNIFTKQIRNIQFFDNEQNAIDFASKLEKTHNLTINIESYTYQ